MKKFTDFLDAAALWVMKNPKTTMVIFTVVLLLVVYAKSR